MTITKEAAPDQSMHALLMAAANNIIEHANALHEAHTVADRWPDEEADTHAIYLRDVGLAGSLMRAARYFKVNPLGGPAKVFDAIANAIRAGESVEAAMRAYGVCWVEQSEAADRDAALSEQQIDALWVDFHLEPTEPATALELAFKAGARAAIQSSKEKN